MKIINQLLTKRRLLWACLLLCSFALAAQQLTARFGDITVEIKQQTLAVEYADTFELRAQGLMFRTELCEQCGMLFKFDQRKFASMWMKNTYIPLDVAYIRADGVITDILPMQPEDMTSIHSSEKVLYALEMNQGWFARNQITVGDTVSIPGNKK